MLLEPENEPEVNNDILEIPEKVTLTPVEKNFLSGHQSGATLERRSNRLATPKETENENETPVYE